MTQRLHIRRYRPGDHDRVWQLHNDALHGVGAHAGNGPWDDDLHHIGQVYIDTGGEFLVGELDGRIVAMGSLRIVEEGVGEIGRMRVAPGCQRRGFGEAILLSLHDAAGRRGLRTLRLGTTTGQRGAQRLYEKHGYRAVGRRRVLGFEVIDYERRAAAGGSGGV